jgi:hypothetical protein
MEKSKFWKIFKYTIVGLQFAPLFILGFLFLYSILVNEFLAKKAIALGDIMLSQNITQNNATGMTLFSLSPIILSGLLIVNICYLRFRWEAPWEKL